jgi:hypothetical protein
MSVYFPAAFMKGPYSGKLTGTESHTPVEHAYFPDAIFAGMHKLKPLKIVSVVKI